MSSGIISASLSAQHIQRTSSGIVRMGAGVYIHNMTPDMARQWAEELNKIAEETNA